MTALIHVPPDASGYLRAFFAGQRLNIGSADVYRLVDRGQLTGYQRDGWMVVAADEVEALARGEGGTTVPFAHG